PNVVGGRPPEEAPRPFARGPRRRDDDAPRGGGAQPDPLKTSQGYIGADSFQRQRQNAQRGGPKRGGAGGPATGGPRGGGSRGGRGR
ncbi:MAG TPA: 23S rRNA pseudouridylate synthase B, partial [Ottowia sp.]|nr:23S rRNA pseudouridylate synthase B [Ottowia sp.]